MMPGHRPLVLTLTAFATALGALGVAAFTGWQRCGRGSECSSELALGILAVAPACLIGMVVLFAVRAMLVTPWLRTFLLAAGIGVAALPLAAFLLQDVWQVPVFLLLLAAAILVGLVGERSAAIEVSLVEGQPPAPPSRALPKERDGAAEATPRETNPLTARVLVLVEEMSALNREIALVGERLSKRD